MSGTREMYITICVELEPHHAHPSKWDWESCTYELPDGTVGGPVKTRLVAVEEGVGLLSDEPRWKPEPTMVETEKKESDDGPE